MNQFRFSADPFLRICKELISLIQTFISMHVEKIIFAFRKPRTETSETINFAISIPRSLGGGQNLTNMLSPEA